MEDKRNFIDPQGLNWDNPIQWLFEGIFKGCACGRGCDIQNDCYELLKAIAYDEQWYSKYFKDKPWEETRYWELILHLFDSKGLTEHGGSVYGSWIEDEGLEVLERAEKYYENSTKIKDS